MAVFLRAIVFLAGLSVSLIVSKNQRANFARFTSFTSVDNVVAEGGSKEPSRSGAIVAFTRTRNDDSSFHGSSGVNTRRRGRNAAVNKIIQVGRA